MDPDTVVRTWFREVWNEGREDAIDRLMAPTAVAHGLGDGPLQGPEGFKPYFRAMRAAFGDFQVRVLRTVVQGDTVVAHCEVAGRHVGDAVGGPATNRPVRFYGMTMARIANGQIVEGWNAFDFLSLYQQLGCVTVPAARVS